MAAPRRETSNALLRVVDAQKHDRLTKMLGKMMTRCRSRESSKQIIEGFLDIDAAIERFNLTGYDAEVKHRMDLNTVNEMLETDKRLRWQDKRYYYAEEFAHDVRLIFKNCMLINKYDSEAFRAAKMMINDFEKELAREYHAADDDFMHTRLLPEVPQRFMCQLLLTDLRRHPMSEWFRAEADWKGLGADYLNKLKSRRGMDLDRVQSNLDSDEYDRPEDGVFHIDSFGYDLGMIWQNAIDYHGVQSSFGVMAKLLMELTVRRLNHLRQANGLVWDYAGTKLKKNEPEGTELQPQRTAAGDGVEDLRAALVKQFDNNELIQTKQRKIYIDAREWRSFDIPSLRADHYIKHGEHLFRPAEDSRVATRGFANALHEGFTSDERKRRRELSDGLDKQTYQLKTELAEHAAEEADHLGAARKRKDRDEVVVHLDTLDEPILKDLRERAGVGVLGGGAAE